MGKNIEQIQSRGGRFRPTSDDLVEVIKATKKATTKVNQKAEKVAWFTFIGVIWFIGILGCFGASSTLYLVSFPVSSLTLATFGLVFSFVMWVVTLVNKKINF